LQRWFSAKNPCIGDTHGQHAWASQATACSGPLAGESGLASASFLLQQCVSVSGVLSVVWLSGPARFAIWARRFFFTFEAQHAWVPAAWSPDALNGCLLPLSRIAQLPQDDEFFDFQPNHIESGGPLGTSVPVHDYAGLELRPRASASVCVASPKLCKEIGFL